ncbi:MAG: tyrosine-type recombinase/integrase [Lacunisphaera sp.]
MSEEPSHEWETLAHRYRQTLLVRGYSVRTLATQGTYARRWTEFCADVKLSEPAAVTPEHVGAFQKWLWHRPTHRGAARGIAGQNNVLAWVKGFFGWLQAEGVLTRNPAALARYAKQPDPLPKDVLTQAEAVAILKAPDVSQLNGQRDRTILETMYATGLRRAELRALGTADVDLEAEVVIVRQGKGGKGRVVPLTRTACACLETYLQKTRPALLAGQDSARLFVSPVNHPGNGFCLGEHALGNIVERYAKAAGIKKKVTPHLWRHTCATHLLQNRANVRHVQEMLGHKSLATTERYLRLTITDLKDAHRRHHPRG